MHSCSRRNADPLPQSPAFGCTNWCCTSSARARCLYPCQASTHGRRLATSMPDFDSDLDADKDWGICLHQCGFEDCEHKPCWKCALIAVAARQENAALFLLPGLHRSYHAPSCTHLMHMCKGLKLQAILFCDLMSPLPPGSKQACRSEPGPKQIVSTSFRSYMSAMACIAPQEN